MALLDGVAKLLQLTPRVLFAVWASGAILLFLPDTIAAILALDRFREVQRQWIGPVTLVAFVLWLSYALAHLGGWLRALWISRKWRRQVLAQLDSLGDEERRALGYFVHTRSPTQYLWLQFGPAQSLCQKGLLVQATGAGAMFTWPYTVPDFVWRAILARREELFPGVDSPAAKQLYDRFDEYQRKFSLRA